MYRRQPSVVLALGSSTRAEIFEAVDAVKLMRRLHECGREGVRVRSVLCARGWLDRRSLNALNCFLRQSRGLRLFNRVATVPVMTRFGWEEFQDYLGFQWVN